MNTNKLNPVKTFYLSLILAFVAIGASLFLTLSASAVEYVLATGYASYDDTSVHPTAIYEGRIHFDNAYVGVSYEDPKVTLQGQGLGNMNMLGAFVGGQFEITKHWKVLADVGVYWPDLDTSGHRRQELEAVVDTLDLVHRRQDFRLPLDPWGNVSFENARYSLSKGYGARLGLLWELKEYIGASLTVRHLRLGEDLDAYNGPTAGLDNGCCWLQRNTKNLTSVSAKIEFRF